MASVIEETFPDELEVLSIRQAGKAVGLNPRTIRLAIKSGELAAFVIGGRDPIRSGRGLGYRIKRADLHAWYFGTNTLPPDGYVPPAQARKKRAS